MLKLQNVSKSYKGKVLAVDNLSLEVRPGEIFGFLGPNGAGKTTTIKVIVGLTEADGGTVRVNGFDNVKYPLEAKKQFGFVPDTPVVYERLTGLEYLNFLGDVYEVPGRQRAEVVTPLARLFEMEEALRDPVETYSRGMRQKLVLIGSLLHDPPLWILDEPMVGLDPMSFHNLKELMKERCRQGKSVFFSTHVLEVAEKLCHRIGIIQKGKLIFCGSLEELAGEKSGNRSLENLFLELTSNV